MKMTEETRKLQEDINGKEVVNIAHSGLRVECVLLWPPDAKKISVKPFGYKPEELLETIEEAWGPVPDQDNADHIMSPEFCFATYEVATANLIEFVRLAAIPIGGEHVFDEIRSDKTDPKIKALFGGGRPMCPNA